MHIPDNYLSPQTDAVMAVAMVPVWAHCIKKVRHARSRAHNSGHLRRIFLRL
ncbi:MAG: energy-coupling factor ABC transporter permease [Collinsella sp.]